MRAYKAIVYCSSSYLRNDDIFCGPYNFQYIRENQIKNLFQYIENLGFKIISDKKWSKETGIIKIYFLENLNLKEIYKIKGIIKPEENSLWETKPIKNKQDLPKIKKSSFLSKLRDLFR